MDIGMIRDLPRVERPRERLLRVGVEGLKEEELLALVLRTGYKGNGVMDLARQLLVAHPLPQLLALPIDRLRALKGMGLSRASTLLAALELVRRTQHRVAESLPRIQSAQDILAQVMDLRDKRKEYLVAFFLNARHQLICRETISIGTLTASLAHPREIFSPAIGQAAAGVILVHNHPSGDPSPSDEDLRLTQRIRQAGHILGIELLDHVIIAETGSYSFKAAGHL